MGLVEFGDGGGERAREVATALARLYICDADGGIATADASPENLCWLKARHPGRPIRFAEADMVRAAIVSEHGAELKHEAVDGLERRLPDLSARRVLSRWVAFLAAMLLATPLWSGFTPLPGASLLANNLMLTYLAVMSPGRRGRGDLAPWGLTVIVYWAFVSLAGYRALIQLVTRPFFWEKTMHGVTPELLAPASDAGAA